MRRFTYKVYRESGSGDAVQYHHTPCASLQAAKQECDRQAAEHGGWVSVTRNGFEVYSRCFEGSQ